MAIKLGMEAVLNYKIGGQGGGGAWTALGNTRDVTLNLETGEADVTTRANSGWRATVATLKEASVEFEMVWDTADAGFTRQKAIPFTWGRGEVTSVERFNETTDLRHG
ncbi:MAG TPA: phage tail tube protein [Vicinamibacterales bacterium]|nr:phage tail tube protein [Vicinamibacterales bacterium]